MAGPSYLQEGQARSQDPISLMDGSSAANAVRAGRSLGAGSSETGQYRPCCNHICLYTEGVQITHPEAQRTLVKVIETYFLYQAFLTLLLF